MTGAETQGGEGTGRQVGRRLCNKGRVREMLLTLLSAPDTAAARKFTGTLRPSVLARQGNQEQRRNPRHNYPLQRHACLSTPNIEPPRACVFELLLISPVEMEASRLSSWRGKCKGSTDGYTRNAACYVLYIRERRRRSSSSSSQFPDIIGIL